jgi:hypothetical protein
VTVLLTTGRDLRDHGTDNDVARAGNSATLLLSRRYIKDEEESTYPPQVTLNCLADPLQPGSSHGCIWEREDVHALSYLVRLLLDA